MRSVFVSYRRDDAGGHAGRLSDRLVARFGDARVFVDVQDIRPGQNFEQAIEHTLAQCDHLLAVIGPRWSQALQSRSQGEDFVRHEVAFAMSRGLTVIPVLVGGARMPGVADLPPELSAFARCQAVEIRDTHFDEDAAGLVRFLAGSDDTMAVGGVRVRHRTAAAVAAVVAVTAGAVWFLSGGTPPAAPGASDAAAPAPIVTPAPDPALPGTPPGTPPANLNAAVPAAAPAAGAVSPGPGTPARAATGSVPGAPSGPALDGDWLAEMRNDRQQAYRIRLTFARVGRVLTGTVRYPTGEAGILDGQIDGTTFSFRTRHVPQFESEPATIQVAGTIDGDRIRLVVTSESGSNTGVATRVGAPAGAAAGSTGSARPSLAYGTWTLRNARDDQGQTWNNSVLQFTEQSETPDGLSLRGRFTWRLADQLRGTEEITGRYVERTRQVILEGVRVTDAPGAGGPDRLAVGSYSAVLSPDERSLLEGRWGSTAENEPGIAGTWEAVR